MGYYNGNKLTVTSAEYGTLQLKYDPQPQDNDHYFFAPATDSRGNMYEVRWTVLDEYFRHVKDLDGMCRICESDACSLEDAECDWDVYDIVPYSDLD